MTTSTMLSVALSRVPAISMPITASATSTAGRLMIPPPCGPTSSVGGQVDARRLQPADQIARPADRDRRAGQRIFEDQAPADDPGERLAERGIAEGIGAARGRDHRRQFGIGQRRAGADRAGDREGQDHRRPGALRADAGQRVDAGADDRADARARSDAASSASWRGFVPARCSVMVSSDLRGPNIADPP